MLNSSKVVFVGNLNFKTLEQDLLSHFKKCGEISNVEIVCDNSGQSKGIGFIKFNRHQDASLAVEKLNGSKLDGKRILVELKSMHQNKCHIEYDIPVNFDTSSDDEQDQKKDSDILKILKVYYKGTCQELRISDNTTECEIFQVMKRIFCIKEDIDQFFLQDSEGRIILIPKNLPDEFSVFLYVRPCNDNFSSTLTNQKNQIIQGPSWTFICTKGTEGQLTNGTHYHYINLPDESLYPSVISSINFSKGKHYSIIKLESHGCGRLGLGLPGSPPEYFSPGWECSSLPKDKWPTFIHINEGEIDHVTHLNGIAIDCDEKIGYFLQVRPDTFEPLKISLKVTDLPVSVLIFAGVKGWNCMTSEYSGITLIKDSLPFPDLSCFNPQKVISWNPG